MDAVSGISLEFAHEVKFADIGFSSQIINGKFFGQMCVDIGHDFLNFGVIAGIGQAGQLMFMQGTVQQNHKLGYEIKETDLALEAWGYTEEEKQEQESEHIGNLKLTKRVFALSLQKSGISYSQLKEFISTNEQAQLEWDLCVELQRKNPLLDLLANSVGISSKQLDEIFIEANKEVQNGNLV